MPYRLYEYTSEILRGVIRNTPKKIAERKGFKFPKVLPVVLYYGVYACTACQSFKEMFTPVTPLTDSYIIILKKFAY